MIIGLQWMTFKSNSSKTVIYLSNLTTLRFLITFLQFKTHITAVFTFNKKQFLICIRLRHLRRAIARARLKHWTRAKKIRLVWLRKLQDVWQIARLKQRSLYFTFCKTERSYKKTMCTNYIICCFIGSVVKIVLSKAATGGVLYNKVFLKFAKFTGKYKCQSLYFNKFAGAATSLLIAVTLSWRGPLSYKNQSIDLQSRANQWTSFYMITAFVMKESTWKFFNIVYRKLMKFSKVLPKENLESSCKR